MNEDRDLIDQLVLALHALEDAAVGRNSPHFRQKLSMEAGPVNGLGIVRLTPCFMPPCELCVCTVVVRG